MAGDGGTLGSANVRITADTTDLNAKVDQAKAKVAEIGPAAGTAREQADALWDAMKQGGDDAADATEKAAGSVEKLETRMSTLGTVGVAAVVLAIGKLYTLLEEYERKNEETAKKLKDLWQQQETSVARVTQVFDDALAAPDAYTRAVRGITSAYEDAKKKLEEYNKLAESEGRVSKYGELAALEKRYLETIGDLSRKYSKKAADDDAKKKEEANKKAIEDDEKMYDEFAKNAQKQANDEDRARQRDIRSAEKMLEIEQRIASTRLQGILSAQTALDRLYATQAAGFNGEGSNNSLEGSINALEIAVRGAAARMGGL